MSIENNKVVLPGQEVIETPPVAETPPVTEPVETPPVVETPAKKTEEPSEVPPEKTVAEKLDAEVNKVDPNAPPPADPATPAGEEVYVPNLKVKVMDQEHEIKPYFKDIITKENEAEIRELHEKALGLPHVKEKYTATKAEVERLKPIEQKYIEQDQQLNYLGTLKETDLHAFTKSVNITDDQIVKLALKITQMTPEQKEEYNKNIQANQDYVSVRQENAALKTEVADNLVKARETELKTCLAQEGIRDVVQEFDAKEGFPGAFEQKVKLDALDVFKTYKVDLSSEQAVQRVIMTMGLSPKAPVAAPQPGSATPAQTPPVVPPTAKPVITNIKGGRQTPAPSPITSTDGLRALHAKEFGS